MLYKHVHETLRQEIRDGVHPVGERLPSEAELTSRFAVSSITLRRALDLLRTEGYVIRRPRLGTVVVSAEPVAPDETPDTGRLLIGCVITNFDETFGSRVLEGLLDDAASDAHLVLKRSRGSAELENEHVRALVQAGVHGLIVLPSSTEFIPPTVLELVTQRFPVVVLDRRYDGVPLSAVHSDNFGGAKLATEHLFGLGHRRVGFVASDIHLTTTDDRRNGWVHAHAAAHIPLPRGAEYRAVEATVPGREVPPEADIERLKEFVASDPQTTGYVVAEYNIAVMLREACRRLGREVPGDVSIVCFDHPDAVFDRGLFRFTHVAQDQYGMGAHAMRQVRAQIADRDAIRKDVLPTTVVPGASAAAPRG